MTGNHHRAGRVGQDVVQKRIGGNTCKLEDGKIQNQWISYLCAFK